MIEIEKINSALSESKFISNVYYFPEIDSTNILSKALSAEGGILVITDYQTKGLGRLNREWESEKGKNLTFSIKKKFEVDSNNIQAVNFYFSYFLLAFIKNFIAMNHLQGNIFPEVNIKWPNDILVNSKKISGLLMENNFNKNEFIIGVGLNVNQEEFSAEYNHKTTSLKKFANKDVDLTRVLIDLISTYEKNIYLLNENNFDLIYKLWKNSNILINHEVKFIDNNNGITYGKIIDLTKDGGIKIQQNSEIFTYYSGEIKPIPENPA